MGVGLKVLGLRVYRLERLRALEVYRLHSYVSGALEFRGYGSRVQRFKRLGLSPNYSLSIVVPQLPLDEESVIPVQGTWGRPSQGFNYML